MPSAPKGWVKSGRLRNGIRRQGSLIPLRGFEMKNAGGEGGIRTPDRGVSPYNGLANRRLQPLGHLSGGYAAASIVSASGRIGSLRRFLRAALLLSFVLALF